MTVQITRPDHDATSLRQQAAVFADARIVRRLLALALVLEGHSRAEAARSCGMDRQTLRDWVIRYNERGIDGLKDKPKSGRPPRLKEAQLIEFDALVEKGPDLETDGVVRWRCVDLKAIVASKFGLDLSEDQIGRILKQRGYTRLSVRPRHPRTDEATQEAFKKTSPRP